MTLRVASMEMRDMMLEAEPKLFYITDHYRNFPFVLARLSALTPKTLKEILVGPRGATGAERRQSRRQEKAQSEKAGREEAQEKKIAAKRARKP